MTVFIDRVMDAIIDDPEITLGELARMFDLTTKKMSEVIGGEWFRDALAQRRWRRQEAKGIDR